jgi:hypothetical protein
VKATAGLWNRQSIEAKLGASISEKEYHSFIEPFEGITRLETIRASLQPEQIVDPAKASASKNRISDFPENLPFKKELAAFRAVYKLLATLEQSSLGLQNTDTFAQHHKLEKRKAHIFRFLWILGNYGHFEKGNKNHLVVEAETYHANRGKEKTLAIWSFVEDVVFKVLAGFGVDGERVVLQGVKEEELLTGTGYLRKRGWLMRMAFREEIGGTAALAALQTYAKKVDKKYGSRAFHRFRTADMRILLNT